MRRHELSKHGHDTNYKICLNPKYEHATFIIRVTHDTIQLTHLKFMCNPTYLDTTNTIKHG